MRKELLIAIAAAVVIIVIAVVFILLTSGGSEEEILVRKSFFIEYSGKIARKDIVISNQQNVQKFLYVEPYNSSQFTAAIVIPKALSTEIASLDISTEDGVTLDSKRNLILFSNSEEEKLELDFDKKGVDSCIMAVMFPIEWFNGLESADKDALLDTIASLDTELNCEDASILENSVGYNLVNTFQE